MSPTTKEQSQVFIIHYALLTMGHFLQSWGPMPAHGYDFYTCADAAMACASVWWLFLIDFLSYNLWKLASACASVA
jgi:hypothetical protein